MGEKYGRNRNRMRMKQKTKSMMSENGKRETELTRIAKTTVNLTVQRLKRTDRQMDWIGSRNQVCWLLAPSNN